MESERRNKTQFEKKLGNTDILELIFQGFLGTEGMAYDILTMEGTYLLTPQRNWQPFCTYLRSTTAGEKLCHQCDLTHMRKAFQRKVPISYVCHAGLMDIVAPIFVEDEPLAAIFTGQAVMVNERNDKAKKLLGLARKAASEAGVDSEQLLSFRKQTRTLDSQQRASIKKGLSSIATWLGKAALDHHVVERLAQRSETLVQATEMLLLVADNTDEAWKTITKVVRMVHRVIDSSVYAGIFMLNDVTENVSIMTTADLPANLREKQYSAQDLKISRAIQESKITVERFRPDDDPLYSDIFNVDREKGASIESMFFTPIDLGKKKATLIFFLRDTVQRIEKSKSAKETMRVVSDIAASVARYYGNALISEQRQINTATRYQWLRAVGHQWKVPMHGIFGYVERLQENYQEWAESDPEKIKNALVSIRMLAQRGTDIANNLLYYRTEDGSPFELKVEDRLEEIFIAKARDVQALARGDGKFGPNVESDQVKLLNGKVAISRPFFSQALVNLLDNAVKYADRGTTINVTSSSDENMAYIDIANTGIQIKNEEMEKIFDPEYRTDDAKSRNPIGTGIGLTIARDIIKAHGGKLVPTCLPSTIRVGRYDVTFTISLPLRNSAV